MIEVRRTAVFLAWIEGLRSDEARALIATRIYRLGQGNFGDVKSVGEGVSELRIHRGPGYRLYFTRRGAKIILLLCGGDKSSQSRDIAKAKALAKEITDAP